MHRHWPIRFVHSVQLHPGFVDIHATLKESIKTNHTNHTIHMLRVRAVAPVSDFVNLGERKNQA